MANLLRQNLELCRKARSRRNQKKERTARRNPKARGGNERKGRIAAAVKVVRASLRVHAKRRRKRSTERRKKGGHQGRKVQTVQMAVIVGRADLSGCQIS